MSGRGSTGPGPGDDDRTLLWEGGPPRDTRPPGPRPRSARRIAARAAKAVLALLLAYYVLALVLLAVYRFAWPPVTGVQLQRRVEARIAGEEYRVRKEPVALAGLPPHVGRAVEAAEDGRFREHRGFDWEAMRSAGEEAAGGGRIRGASTITQQLVKNLFGCACRNPVRKAYDLALTPAAELVLGKDRILELYLNQVEWGRGVFGVEAAARHHYDVGAAELTREQAAGLAALLPAPLRRTPENTRGYRREILRRMRHRGW